MKSQFAGGFMIGFFIALVVMIYVTWAWPTDEQVGMTFIEMKNAIEDCEKSLPRDKSCKVTVIISEEK